MNVVFCTQDAFLYLKCDVFKQNPCIGGVIIPVPPLISHFFLQFTVCRVKEALVSLKKSALTLLYV